MLKIIRTILLTSQQTLIWLQLQAFQIIKYKNESTIGPLGLKLLKQIGMKNGKVTGEKLSTYYLLQSISLAILQLNFACVTGTLPT